MIEQPLNVKDTTEQALELDAGEKFRFGAYHEKDAEQIRKAFEVLLPNGFDFSTRPAGSARYSVMIERTYNGDN